MQEIKLEQRPNQAFTLVLNNVTYRIRIADLGSGHMVSDVNMNSVDVVFGQRCLHGDFMLPFAGMTLRNGNFMWFDDRAGTPRWENFGDTCRLYYVSQAEIDALTPVIPGTPK